MSPGAAPLLCGVAVSSHEGAILQNLRGGDVAQLVDHRTVMPPTQVRFAGTVRDSLPRVNFQCRLSFCVRTPPCALACINSCEHDKDPVVHTRVRWMMATQTYPARNISDKKQTKQKIDLMIVVAQAQIACWRSMAIFALHKLSSLSSSSSSSSSSSIFCCVACSCASCLCLRPPLGALTIF